jgi:plastocyanin
VVTVHHGTRVVWRFRGQDSHNVTVSHGPRKFHSHTQSDGTFAKVINTRGTYRIYCTVHGAAVMRMTLKVR